MLLLQPRELRPKVAFFLWSHNRCCIAGRPERRAPTESGCRIGFNLLKIISLFRRHRVPAHASRALARKMNYRAFRETVQASSENGWIVGIFRNAQEAAIDLPQSPCQTFSRRAPTTRRRPLSMSLEANLEILEARHRSLEQEISDALAHPSTDDAVIVELKRRKLQVKDEITRLRHSVH
jgi:hypothetical protein